MLTVVFGESNTSRTQVQTWYNQFDLDAHPGRWNTSPMKTLKQ